MQRSYVLVPLPDLDNDEFERRMNEDIMPAVDMGPTRGGRILLQRLLRSESRRYNWDLRVETTGGEWFESRLKPALDLLSEVAVTCGMTEGTVILERDPGD